jgi:hypothetical protein
MIALPRQRIGAFQELAFCRITFKVREASWSAVVLYSFVSLRRYTSLQSSANSANLIPDFLVGDCAMPSIIFKIACRGSLPCLYVATTESDRQKQNDSPVIF